MKKLGTIYTDYCLPSLIKQYETLDITMIVRDENAWNINYVIQNIANSELDVVIINNINEKSIVEIGIAAFLCKTILVTTKLIESYPSIREMVNEIQLGCNLYQENNSLINWLKCTLKGRYEAFL